MANRYPANRKSAVRPPPSQETKDKIRATLTGRRLSPEACQKRSEAQAGRPMPEACMRALKDQVVQAKRLAALRAAFAARPKKPQRIKPEYGSQGWRDAISAALTTPERRARRSATMKEVMSRPGARQAIRLAQWRLKEENSRQKREWWADLTDDERREFVARRGEGQRRWWATATEEQKQQRIAKVMPALSTGAKAYATKFKALPAAERRRIMEPVWAASQNANPSSIEETVARLLDALGVKYRRQAYIGRFLVDFWVKSKLLVIECDGSYWHNLPGRPEADAKRDAWLTSRGFSVLRLKEADIRAGRVAAQLAEIA